MGAGLYSHTTRAAGSTLTANIYNTDHQNHIDNHNSTQIDDYSASVAEMQTMTDPGDVGSESQATSLAGELERIRFVLDAIIGGAQWYTDPASDIATIDANALKVDNTGLIVAMSMAIL
tara:strand:+ start:3466 stop:3822 length:357 start_codon:yes stop_codon:yes gene_type:complete